MRLRLKRSDEKKRGEIFQGRGKKKKKTRKGKKKKKIKDGELG